MNKNLVTPYKYAKLCETTTAAIYYRINAGIIIPHIELQPDGKEKRYIDTLKYTPTRFKSKKNTKNKPLKAS